MSFFIHNVIESNKYLYKNRGMAVVTISPTYLSSPIVYQALPQDFDNHILPIYNTNCLFL